MAHGLRKRIKLGLEYSWFELGLGIDLVLELGLNHKIKQSFCILVVTYV